MHTLEELRTGQLHGTKRLTLSCGLTEFPLEILDLAESLEVLDLSNNHLRTLPPEFSQLKHLKSAFFFNNEFEELPTVVAECPNLDILGFKSNRIKRIPSQALSPNLRWLILTNNQIEVLPSAMGNLGKLQKLMLAGNQLQSLPGEMAACHSLELIRISANRFQSLPLWLMDLPRLSWLAYAGNPFCADIARPVATNQVPLATIDWSELELGETLGQGASGVISKGTWTPLSGPSMDVAIKVFKGNVTSDGFPLDEMQACIGAGFHAGLIQVLGKIDNGPSGKQGLVLALIPPQYRTLGGPPNLETCTRDTYAPETRFSLSTILQITQDIASVAAHLHHRGMMHGDLYPHNILLNDSGESLLGDFGAASFYDSGESTVKYQLERLEVRAFGCLLDDLLTRYQSTADDNESAVMDDLHRLQQDCMNTVPTQRPLFIKICDRLTGIAQMAQTPELAESVH